MNHLVPAQAGAQLVTLLVFIVVARWYVAPWLAARCRAEARSQAGSADGLLLRDGGVAQGVSAGQAPWPFLNFLPLPHQHGSLRPMFSRADLSSRFGAPAVVV